MAGLVSGRKAMKTNAPGSGTGRDGAPDVFAPRLSCYVLKLNCPGVSRLCPGVNMQIENTKCPIGKDFRRLSRLSRLSRHISVGVGRKIPATGARVGGGQSIFLRQKMTWQDDLAGRRAGFAGPFWGLSARVHSRA